MKRGDEVIRVSVRSESDPGVIGESGVIERAYSEAGETFGYSVVWKTRPSESQYVAPARIVTTEEWTRSQRA